MKLTYILLALQPSDTEVFDILLALKKLPLTIELLRETKIGNSVYDAKKKFAAGSLSFNESKDIIALWKKSCDVQVSVPKSTSDSSGSQLEGVIKRKMPVAKVVAPLEEENEENEVEKNYDALSQTRRKVKLDSFLERHVTFISLLQS